MLIAIEGGGFFSSSASGYSKGLTLLLFGRKNEDRPMRVAPWNHYQLVDQEPDPEIQLASKKKRFLRRCASFACFRRTSAELDSPSHLKVDPAEQQEGPLVDAHGKDHLNDLDDRYSNVSEISLKSVLKKPSNSRISVTVESNGVPELETSREANLCDLLGENDDDIPHTERRSVQWTDTCGSELVEIREFEPSETSESDDEFDHGTKKSCSCTIM